MHAGLIVCEKRELKHNSSFEQKHLNCVYYGKKMKVKASNRVHSKKTFKRYIF